MTIHSQRTKLSQLIHRDRSNSSLHIDAGGGNVLPTDARHEPPGNGSQTTKQSARPCQARVAEGNGG